MAKKRRADKLHSVMFEYAGTDKEFDEFLRLLLHDYLAVDHPSASTKEMAEHSEHPAA
jgi:hypothetical protein